MNRASLCAGEFKYSSTYFNKSFEYILCEIINIYKDIVAKKLKMENDENKIKDVIFNKYLKKDKYKKNHPPLSDYHFSIEGKEPKGRTDIQILPINPYLGQDCYYIIECKRLDNKKPDGMTGLNAQYIEEGIDRFINAKKYPAYKNTAGMIGFVVASMDIDNNIKSINKLLKNCFPAITTTEFLTKKQLRLDFSYAYFSKHEVEGKEKLLYHLMFDFSLNM